LGCEKPNPVLWPKPEGAFCPNGALVGGWPNPPPPLPRVARPNEKVEGDGAGDASFPKPEPKGPPVCEPNPEEAEDAEEVEAPNPPPFAAVDPNENPVPLLAALNDDPFVAAASPPRIGLASMLSSSKVFVKGVVGPLGNTSPGAPVFELPTGAPKENPLPEGVDWPKPNEALAACLPFGVESPGVPNAKDGVVEEAAGVEPKSNDLPVVGVL